MAHPSDKHRDEPFFIRACLECIEFDNQEFKVLARLLKLSLAGQMKFEKRSQVLKVLVIRWIKLQTWSKTSFMVLIRRVFSSIIWGYYSFFVLFCVKKTTISTSKRFHFVAACAVAPLLLQGAILTLTVTVHVQTFFKYNISVCCTSIASNFASWKNGFLLY